jgi:hypothetical protein
MEEFYDENYETRHVLTIENIYHERIWSVFYDNKLDQIYLFVGKIKQIKGNKFNNIVKIFGL